MFFLIAGTSCLKSLLIRMLPCGVWNQVDREIGRTGIVQVAGNLERRNFAVLLGVALRVGSRATATKGKSSSIGPPREPNYLSHEARILPAFCRGALNRSGERDVPALRLGAEPAPVVARPAHSERTLDFSCCKQTGCADYPLIVSGVPLAKHWTRYCFPRIG
jgi:hypothetical protein